MLTLLEPARLRPRLEALPHPSSRRQATRSSIDDRPQHHTPLPGEWRELTVETRPPLPSELRGVRAVVVDDDEDTVELFAAALTACGAEVRTATTAPDALRLLASQPADVVLTDIAMPGADGYWLVREIRRLADAQIVAVPVIAVTAYGQEHSPTRTAAAGFTGHLQKPVDPEALCRAVARAAGR